MSYPNASLRLERDTPVSGTFLFQHGLCCQRPLIREVAAGATLQLGGTRNPLPPAVGGSGLVRPK